MPGYRSDYTPTFGVIVVVGETRCDPGVLQGSFHTASVENLDLGLDFGQI